MHLELHQIHFLLIQAAILSICFPSFLCQNNSQYATCVEPFNCGSLRNISFPFWGGRRPSYCGYPGFELNCDGDVPLLNISSIFYRVLDVNFSSYTLKVAREDLWNNTCPAVHRNTTFDTDVFEIPQNSSDGDVTLYYDCASRRGQQIGVRNQFNCTVNGVSTVNVFDAGDLTPGGPGSNITCNSSISVPVNQTAAQALETPTASSLNLLTSALATGFSVQWSADNADCGRCQRSGGTCVYSLDSVLTGMPPGLSPGAMDPTAGNRSNPGLPGQVGITIGVTVGITCLIIFAIVIVCYLKRRRRRRPPARPEQVNKKGIETFLHQHGSLAPKRYKYWEIKKFTKAFSDKLGQGGYGSVYKGVLPDGSLVAVKVLIETDSNGEEFINEVASISRTSHVNIVNLLGFCYDGKKRALVYEFMPNLSLDKFISSTGPIGNANCDLDLDKLYRIAIGVAKGLEYLHTGCTTRIVHFDIKPQNILLDEDLCPKISDFGLAKLCKKKQSALSVLGTRGTIGYIAPEIFSRNFGRVSHKSDVYSYGMMVLEMVGANKLVESESQSSENYFPDKIYELATRDVTTSLDDEMAEGERETLRKMMLVGFWCIQTAPSDRPLMSKVVEMLEGSLQSIQIPPKPVLITPNQPEQEFSASLSEYTKTENSAEVIDDS